MNRPNAKTAMLAALLATASCAWAADPPQHTAGEILDDTMITTKVKAALVADPITKAHQISVDTYKGTVKLSGNVDSAEAERRAVEIARDVKGAVSVEDNISVRH
jgi:osmotically-inducible protein OsmY